MNDGHVLSFEGLTMRVVPAAVLWRQDERTGRGDGSYISLSKERDGGSGGDTEQGSGRIRLSVAGRKGSAGGVAKGAWGHGDGLT